jgi:hypothetical protein
MADLPTIKQALADEELRDRLVAEVLMPGPWKHKPEDGSNSYDGRLQTCDKECGAERQMDWSTNHWGDWYDENGKPAPDCPIPDPAPGSEADIAEALVRKLVFNKEEWDGEGFAYRIVKLGIEVICGSSLSWQQLTWWLTRTPEEKQVVCLLALGKVRRDAE